MGAFTNLTGRRFGRLVVTATFEKRKPRNQSKVFWLCNCECGKEAWVFSHQLTAGITKSCGCFRRESATKRGTRHGRHGTPEYRAWMNMNRRCNNRNTSDYKNYGGRGIAVCARWQSFERFLKDMGTMPGKGYTVDRRDNDGNYEPGNCQWATKKEQNRNSRHNHLVTHGGKTLPVSVWAELMGMPRKTLSARLHRGWSVAEAIDTPLR